MTVFGRFRWFMLGCGLVLVGVGCGGDREDVVGVGLPGVVVEGSGDGLEGDREGVTGEVGLPGVVVEGSGVGCGGDREDVAGEVDGVGSASGSVPEGSGDREAALDHPAVQSYSREYSVSLTDAKRYLDRIWPVKQILVSIMALEDSRFAGLGIDHGAGFMAWVWLTGDDPPCVEAARIADAHGDVEIRTGARYTYTQLRNAQDALDFDAIVESAPDREEAARIADMVVYTDVDVRSNSVEVGVDPDLMSGGRTRRGAPDPLSDEDLTAMINRFADTIKDYVNADVQVTVGPGAEPG